MGSVTYTVVDPDSSIGTYTGTIVGSLLGGPLTTGTLTVNEGADVTLVAVPGTGYEFSAWDGMRTDNTATQSFPTIDQDWDLIAIFVGDGTGGGTYTVDVTYDPTKGHVEYYVDDGVHTPYTGTYTGTLTVADGAFVSMEVIAEAGYRFSAWKGTVDSSQNPLEIDGIAQNYTLTVVFVGSGIPGDEKTYTITVEY